MDLHLTECLHSKCAVWLGVAGCSIGLVLWLRNYMQGGKFTKQISAEGKVVIVTGCNTGIGKETVRDLARRGATIYMACRDMRKSEAARIEIVSDTKNSKIHCLPLDLNSLESVRQFVQLYKARESKLNILINNAGVMMTPYSKTLDGFEQQIGVNHLGHFLLTNLLLDLLKSSAPSRIVVVSSLAHRRGKINKDDLNSEKSYDKREAYGQSKLANILFTHELSKRLQGTGVTVNALHPGVVDTELARNIPLVNYLRYLLKIIFWPLLKTPVNGAQTTLYAALDPDLHNVSGKYFSDCALKECEPQGKDDDMAKWLWTTSEKLTKLKQN